MSKRFIQICAVLIKLFCTQANRQTYRQLNAGKNNLLGGGNNNRRGFKKCENERDIENLRMKQKMKELTKERQYFLNIVLTTYI